MKIILLGIGLLSIVSCSRTPEAIRSEIKKLEGVEAELKHEISVLSAQKIELSEKIDEQKFKIHVQEGGNVRYILKLKLKQERGFNMDMDKALKDMMNEHEFDLPVDRTLYNQVNVGDKIVDAFRDGSYMTEGSASRWIIKVIAKNRQLVE